MLSSRPWHNTVAHRSSIPIRAVSLPAPNSPKCGPTTGFRSAWTAKVPGETTSSSSASGEPSNMRKSICTPMKASARHDNRSVDTSPSITQGDLMQPLTDAPPIRPTSTRCRSARQLNPRPTTPLSDAEILFKEPGPPQSAHGPSRQLAREVKCPELGVHRKWPNDSQNGAPDPTATSEPRPRLPFLTGFSPYQGNRSNL